MASSVQICSSSVVDRQARLATLAGANKRKVGADNHDPSTEELPCGI
jgi:hypothetical protein